MLKHPEGVHEKRVNDHAKHLIEKSFHFQCFLHDNMVPFLYFDKLYYLIVMPKAERPPNR